MNNLDLEQSLVYNTIKNMIDRARLPHALIFYGDKSTSKLEMALFLVKYLYSKLPDINQELIEKRIDDNSLTNLFIIEGEKGVVKKNQIVDIIFEAQKSSLEDGPKVFIFKDADNLNQSSANSLLKFIEEPLEDIYIIFLSDNLNKIIPTIKSRCALLSFKPLNKKAVKEKAAILGLEEGLLSVLSEYTQNIDEIKRISEDDSLMRIYSLVMELFNEPYEKNGSMILYLNENSKLINDDNEKEFFISLIVYYLNDILSVISFENSEIVFKSQEDRIKELSNLYSSEDLLEIVKTALDIKSRIKYHINFRLNIDKLLLDLESALKR